MINRAWKWAKFKSPDKKPPRSILFLFSATFLITTCFLLFQNCTNVRLKDRLPATSISSTNACVSDGNSFTVPSTNSCCENLNVCPTAPNTYLCTSQFCTVIPSPTPSATPPTTSPTPTATPTATPPAGTPTATPAPTATPIEPIVVDGTPVPVDSGGGIGVVRDVTGCSAYGGLGELQCQASISGAPVEFYRGGKTYLALPMRDLYSRGALTAVPVFNTAGFENGRLIKDPRAGNPISGFGQLASGDASNGTATRLEAPLSGDFLSLTLSKVSGVAPGTDSPNTTRLLKRNPLGAGDIYLRASNVDVPDHIQQKMRIDLKPPSLMQLGSQLLLGYFGSANVVAITGVPPGIVMVPSQSSTIQNAYINFDRAIKSCFADKYLLTLTSSRPSGDLRLVVQDSLSPSSSAIEASLSNLPFGAAALDVSLNIICHESLYQNKVYALIDYKESTNNEQTVVMSYNTVTQEIRPEMVYPILSPNIFVGAAWFRGLNQPLLFALHERTLKFWMVGRPDWTTIIADTAKALNPQYDFNGVNGGNSTLDRIPRNAGMALTPFYEQVGGTKNYYVMIPTPAFKAPCTILQECTCEETKCSPAPAEDGGPLTVIKLNLSGF